MKKFFNYLLAVATMLIGIGFTACQDDFNDDKGGLLVNVKLKSVDTNNAYIEVITRNIREFAYMVDEGENLPNSAILAAGMENGTLKTIESTKSKTTTQVKISGVDAETTHFVYFAFRKDDGTLYNEVKEIEFTTNGYGDKVLTVADVQPQGIAVHIQIPEEVKARGNALRYSGSSLFVYNTMLNEAHNISPQALLYNAGQYTTEDKTVRYDEYNSYERDENGNVVYYGEEPVSYCNPIAPGEPLVFLVGEYSFMDESMKDEEDYPGGWEPGYYRPLYDYEGYIAALDSGQDVNDEDYWTGYFERILIRTTEPEQMTEDTVHIDFKDSTPADVRIVFTPTDGVMEYHIMICDESEYQSTILPRLDNNEEYLQWLLTSYAVCTPQLGAGFKQGLAGQQSIHTEDWFSIQMAGKKIRVAVTGFGSEDGMKQCFNTAVFEVPKATLPRPEITVTPIPGTNPYRVNFNIKNTSPDGQDIVEAYFACNYVREFDAYKGKGTYLALLEGQKADQLGQYKFDQNALKAINSEEGYVFTMDSRENATTRLAVLGYNREKTPNDVDAPESPAIAEVKTPMANFPAWVDSELFDKLVGEWTATAPMVAYNSETQSYDSIGNYTSDVTISAGVEYPETLPNEVYALYTGMSRDEVDALYEEFVELAEQYNERTRGYNRLLCLGFNFADPVYLLNEVATPYDLFTNKDYSTPSNENIFYDFGPKWNLEIDNDGSVWMPIDISHEYPMSTWNMGTDYPFYIIAASSSSYKATTYDPETAEVKERIRFPVEVSSDYNTITIKPFELQGATFYPAVAQMVNGYAQFDKRPNGNIVLKRNK